MNSKKKTKHQALKKATIYKNKNQSIASICNEFKLQRDTYYKFKNRYKIIESLEGKVVIIVLKKRANTPS